MFDLADPHVFARIADLGSLSGAARALGMPQSFGSRSLARLEATAGSALIERSTRQLRLTDAGRVLQRHAEGRVGVVPRSRVSKSPTCDRSAAPGSRPR